MKWIFFDLGATLVDETDVYISRCEYAIKQLNISREDFMNKVYEEARICPTPIRAAAKAYGVALPEWDNSLEKLYEATGSMLAGLYGKYRLGIIANQSAERRTELITGVLDDILTSLWPQQKQDAQSLISRYLLWPLKRQNANQHKHLW